MPKNEKKKLLNTFDLIQYAHFNNAVKLNILTYMYDKGETKIQVDGVLNHYRTLITNTVAGSNDTSRMAFATIGYGMNFRYSQSVSKSDFSIAVSGAFLAMSLLNNHRNYYQIQGVRYEENRDNLVERRDYQLAEKPWNKVIAILQTEVSYQKKAWLRFQLYTNPFLLPQGAQLRQYCNNYLQVQYGITQEIKDIVRFFSPDTKKTTQE